jgi:hypothetical protein
MMAITFFKEKEFKKPLQLQYNDIMGSQSNPTARVFQREDFFYTVVIILAPFTGHIKS